MIAVKLKLHPTLNPALWRQSQVTYVCRNPKGQRIVYCLQYQGEAENPKVRSMRCSQDGEPSHEVNFNKIRAEFELPLGDSRTEILAREWSEAYEAVTL